MPENVADVEYSPAWWMKVLGGRRSRKLEDRREGTTLVPGVNTLQSWMDNDPPLPAASKDWEEAYAAFHKDSLNPVAPLIVASVANRLNLLGFRTAASDDDNGDSVAARVWDRNEMDVEQVDIIGDMLGLRDGYAMIGPPRKGSDIPVITSEDPRQIITAHDPAIRSEVRAGLKTMRDEDAGIDYVFVYLPADRLYDPNHATVWTAWKRTGRGSMNFTYGTGSTWEWKEPIKLPTTRVPIVRFENRKGKAEFEHVITNLGRINRIVLRRMLVGEIQAFRQRAIEGLPDRFPDDFSVPELRGKKIDYEGIFAPGPGTMWKVPPGAKFWESQPIDMNPMLNEERMEYRTLSALTGMPVYYFNPDDTNGSAEGATTQRENLTFRTKDRKRIADARFRMTMSHAFEMMDDRQRMEIEGIQTIWAPIEQLSLMERYQAAVLARSAGLAVQTIRREVLELTPRQMKQALADDAEDMIMGRTNIAPTPSEARGLTARQAQPAPRPVSRETAPVVAAPAAPADANR